VISVSEALSACFDLVDPLDAEKIPLAEAAGRVLAQPVCATRDQPPFAASAMDGYAILGIEAEPHAMFKVIGESAAGHGFSGHLKPGQAVRIFTGAPLPEGADHVIIQEDTRRNGDLITLNEGLSSGQNIRPKGADFQTGETLAAPRTLTAGDIALIASMNVATLTVVRRPKIALIATGDELVMPGETPGPDQIIASNSFGLKAMFEKAGADVRMLPIARDNAPSLRAAFELAEGADLLVTIGGASVGDHDLVAPVANELGMEQAFYKVAMRPGKPLMAGRLGKMAMIGLPGNPVSSMVCGTIFILPMIQKLLGFEPRPVALNKAKLSTELPPNGPREHYMRSVVKDDVITAFSRQDSALLTVLSQANALLVRPPHDPARKAGETVKFVPI